jgi:regulator of RNase E activity RraA
MNTSDAALDPITFQIIDRIRRNRISTTEVADCLGKSGALPNVIPLNRQHFRVGPVYWVYAYNESNWELHEQVREVGEDQILLVETFDCNGRAVFGELVAKFAILYRQVAGIVVCGKLRDVPHLLKENWPIWYEGPTPIGCFNRKNESPLDPQIVSSRRELYSGAIAVCDDSGVVVIPRSAQSPSFLDALDAIEELEDKWFECIDRFKWDTFETVCLKKYETK